jgi:hypothetical protein
MAKHVGPFDLNALRGMLRAGMQHAQERAERERAGMVVYPVRNAAIGGGQGVAVRPATEPAPEDSQEYAIIAYLGV